MIAHGMKADHVSIPPDKTIMLEYLLGIGATSNVYKVLIEGKENAMKMCNSNRNVHFIEHEKAILEELRGLPNIPTIVSSDTHSITFPVYTPCGETLSKKNMLALLGLLRKVHEKNICHRDLKPENMLLDSSQNVVLIDWGYAVKSSEITECAGTAFFCAEQYAKSYIAFNDDYYHPKYDCESLLKCFYYMKDLSLRCELIQRGTQYNSYERFKISIDVWREVKDEDFKNCLKEIRTGDMYNALEKYINEISEDEMEY